MRRDESIKLPVIGWREWLRLPELHVHHIKAKIDTGARSSSLHASDIVIDDRGGVQFVRFSIHPFQLRTSKVVSAEAQVLEFRPIKSSNGQIDMRPVIMTTLKMMGQKWQIELTLTDRADMGFRMLLGREAFRGRFLIDPGKSFYGGKPKKKKKT